MIKFVLPVLLFIATVYGISYFWTNSSLKSKKILSLSLIATFIVGICLIIFLILD